MLVDEIVHTCLCDKTDEAEQNDKAADIYGTMIHSGKFPF
jgi:hypothetical protein